MQEQTEKSAESAQLEIDAIKDLHIQLITRLAVIEGILVKKNLISLEDISKEEDLVLQELKAGFGQTED
jgi:hypothetical protein